MTHRYHSAGASGQPENNILIRTDIAEVMYRRPRGDLMTIGDEIVDAPLGRVALQEPPNETPSSSHPWTLGAALAPNIGSDVKGKPIRRWSRCPRQAAALRRRPVELAPTWVHFNLANDTSNSLVRVV
ncbi:hypothetical protein AB0877_07430 [Micromonospora sp. NPDC047644]|uniref:hypothetical protein n=1 Tax=Micromonospora sp. NPDC047644 TaxID=3157203 RepID=UPI003454AAA5